MILSNDYLSNRRGGDAEELVGFQTGAADQRSVDVRLGKQLAGVARLDAAAVQDSHLGGGSIIVSLRKQPAKVSMHLFRLLRRGDFSRADGPNRLVGDHKPLDLVGRHAGQASRRIGGG